MKPSVTKRNSFFPYLLLFIQPIFMASNIIVARGGVEYVPPVSLAFWRWLTVFIILFPFFFNEILKKKKDFKSEFIKLFFLGLMGCGVCGAFPFIAGMSTTMANMGIIYTSSPVFIIILSVLASANSSCPIQKGTTSSFFPCIIKIGVFIIFILPIESYLSFNKSLIGRYG